MRQKNIIILFLVILFLAAAAGAVWYFGFYAAKPAVVNLNQQPTPSPAVSPGEAGKLSDEANYQPSQEMAFRYFLDLGLKYRERAYCTKIENTNQREICLKKVDESLMKDPQEVKDCANIGGTETKTNCFENLAIKTNNIAVCGNLAETERNTCKFTYVYAKINSGNIELCQELQPAEQAGCFDAAYLNQFLATGNKEVCNNIKDETLKSNCLGGTL